MGFRFSLAEVLRFRKIVEYQQEMRLLEANRVLLEKRSQIQRVDEYLQARSSCLRRHLQEGTYASELQFEILSGEGIYARRKGLAEAAMRLEREREQQRENVRKARAAREILEAVRDHHLRLYREQKQRQEQRSLDEMFVMRRKFPRG